MVNPNQGMLGGSPLSQENLNSFRSRTVTFNNTVSENISGSSLQSKQKFTELSKDYAQKVNEQDAKLSTIQEQFNSIQKQLTTLTNGITQMGILFQQDTASEQRLLQEEKDQEQQFFDQKIRRYNESQLERKIENAVISPVQAVTARVQGIFGNVAKAITALFVGWIAQDSIKALQLWSNKNEDGLTTVKTRLMNHLKFGLLTLAAIKGGIGLVKFTLTTLTKTLTKLAYNLIRLPFIALGKIFSKFTLPTGPISGPGGKKPGAGPVIPSAPKLPKAQGFWGGVKNFTKGLGKGLIPGITFQSGIDIFMGEDPKKAVVGATGAAAAAKVAAAVVPPHPLVKIPAMLVASFLGTDMAKNAYDWFTGKTPESKEPEKKAKEKEKKDNVKEVKPTKEYSAPFTGETPPTKEEKETSIVTPSATLTPTPKDYTVNFNNEEGDIEYDFSKNTKLSVTPNLNTFAFSATDIESISDSPIPLPATTTKVSPEKIESTKPLVKSLPPVEPEEPNVIVTPIPEKRPTSNDNSGPSKLKVPFVSSSNDDNIYVMFSRMHYNVVL